MSAQFGFLRWYRYLLQAITPYPVMNLNNNLWPIAHPEWMIEKLILQIGAAGIARYQRHGGGAANKHIRIAGSNYLNDC